MGFGMLYEVEGANPETSPPKAGPIPASHSSKIYKVVLKCLGGNSSRPSHSTTLFTNKI